MPLTEIMAAIGAAVQGTLALLLLVVWRSLRVRWTLLLAGGFATLTLQYGNVALGHFSSGGGWSSPPSTANAALSFLSHGLVTWGLIDYVGLPPSLARRWRIATALAVALLLAALAAGLVTRAIAFGVVLAFLSGWAVLFGWALEREPRAGHGIVLVAVLTYPVAMASALVGWLGVTGAGISLIVPDVVLGMTLLTTGLVRAHRASAREIVARQHAQAELERSNQTLELRVAQRTAQLRETIDGLESFNRSVSHDLRGPLGGITGVAVLAREALEAGDVDGAGRLLAAIERQSRGSADLVGALLQLARASDATVERRPVQTLALVRDLVEELAATDVPIEVLRIDQALPDLDADPALLRQVFANLIGNGLKFSRGADAPRVEVGATRGEQGLVFHVRDNGIGFSDEQSRDLFEPFRRLHGTRFEGHGIGLTIVRRIVDRHGGRLWAEGRPGAGATFYFTLEQEVVR